ncbi:MAG: hypothetical protein ABI609_02545 [Acidobacteriota bacterium]
MSGLRAVVVFAVLGLSLASRGAAVDAPASRSVEISRTMRYQSPSDAVVMVRYALSPVGTAEIRGKEVVVRDSAKRLERVQELLDDFDHPLIPLRVVVQLVQASGVRTPPVSSNISEPLLGRLRKSLRYANYQLLAQVGFEAKEGTDVSSHVGEGFSIAFRLGTVRLGQSVRLQNFSMKGDDATASLLLDTNLVLALDHPLAVGLTTDEDSDTALVVVLTCSRVSPQP